MIPVYFSNSDNKKENFSIVIGSNGAFVHYNNNMYITNRPLKNQLNWLDLPEVKESAEIKLPKINYSVYQQFVDFAQKVYKQYKAEAVILLTLNRDIPFKDQSYKIRVPKQTVSSSAIKYDIDEEFEKGEFLVGSIHSHPAFNAFQSSTDKNDEINFDGLHITVGNVEGKLDVHGRFCCMSEVYDLQEKSMDKLISTVPPFEKLSCPDDWLRKVSEATIVTKDIRASDKVYFFDLFLPPFKSQNNINSTTLFVLEFK